MVDSWSTDGSTGSEDVWRLLRTGTRAASFDGFETYE
jgi:hypothetical protein